MSERVARTRASLLGRLWPLLLLLPLLLPRLVDNSYYVGILSRIVVYAMLVASLGLVPAALSHGIGSDSQRPFAIVIVGGLMAVLLMSIFLLPCLYVWVARDGDSLPEPDRDLAEQE